MSHTDANRLCEALLPAVLEAGRLEMRHFSNGVKIEKKADKSPVTAADREAEAIIVAALARVLPDVPVVAEEAASEGVLPPPARRFVLVDALDGTRQFIAGKPEFSINIAIVEDTRPVFGLIYGPASGSLYVTRSGGLACAADVMPDADLGALKGLNWSTLRVRATDRTNLLAFNSRTAGGASADFLAELNVKDARPLGSSLKFCLIAKGEGDIYARFGATCEWDTAAGQAILEAAGGTVATLDGKPLSYGKAAGGYLNPHFVAWGGPPLLTRPPPILPQTNVAGQGQ
jgi:3'(2'), 5'-bisphosphate nucleotidase